MINIELLAPAGDLERAKVALDFGADAIYIGGKRFSLRYRASNFEIQDIKDAVDYAHAKGKRVFVTVNMIPHQGDLKGLEEYLIELNSIHVDAVIVASIGIAKLSKIVAPNMEVHLSTQLSITNTETMKFYKEFGVDRIVLARELSMDTIKEITNKNILPIEVFIHGGMCVNYSGRCTLSNEMTLRDANRGGCAQSCRWAYDLYQNGEKLSTDDTAFSMGSKDLMAMDQIENMMKAGVYSLKVEGRMKSAYYIGVIIKAYRRWIDAINSNTATPVLFEELLIELKQAESRPTFNGFLTSLPDSKGHLYHPKEEGVVQNFVGTVINTKPGYIQVEMRNLVSLGQELECFSYHSIPESFKVEELLDEENQSIEVANKPMSKIWMKCGLDVRVNDFIRKKGSQ